MSEQEIKVLKGSRDMLRESAKQFRLYKACAWCSDSMPADDDSGYCSKVCRLNMEAMSKVDNILKGN